MGDLFAPHLGAFQKRPILKRFKVIFTPGFNIMTLSMYQMPSSNSVFSFKNCFSLLQMLLFRYMSSTKDFIFNLSILSKAVWRILLQKNFNYIETYVSIFFTSCGITKNSRSISVDLSFYPILILISTHPPKGMSSSSPR